MLNLTLWALTCNKKKGIDNTSSTEIFINFSSLSHWPGAPQIDNPLLSPISTPHHHRHLNIKQVIQRNLEPDCENVVWYAISLFLSR